MAVYDWGLSHVYLPQLDAQGAVHKYADITVSDRWGVLSPMYFYGDSLGDTPAKMSPRPGVIDLWADDPMRVDIEVRLAEGTYTLHGVDMYGDPTEMALTNKRLEVAAAPTLSPDLVLRGDSDTEASFHDYASDLDRTVGGESGTVGFYGSDGTTKGSILDQEEEPSVTALLEALQGLGLLAIEQPPEPILVTSVLPGVASGVTSFKVDTQGDKVLLYWDESAANTCYAMVFRFAADGTVTAGAPVAMPGGSMSVASDVCQWVRDGVFIYCRNGVTYAYTVGEDLVLTFRGSQSTTSLDSGKVQTNLANPGEFFWFSSNTIYSNRVNADGTFTGTVSRGAKAAEYLNFEPRQSVRMSDTLMLIPNPGGTGTKNTAVVFDMAAATLTTIPMAFADPAHSAQWVATLALDPGPEPSTGRFMVTQQPASPDYFAWSIASLSYSGGVLTAHDRWVPSTEYWGGVEFWMDGQACYYAPDYLGKGTKVYQDLFGTPQITVVNDGGFVPSTSMGIAADGRWFVMAKDGAGVWHVRKSHLA